MALQILLHICHCVSEEKGGICGPSIKWEKEKMCEKSMYLGYGIRICILYAKKKSNVMHLHNFWEDSEKLHVGF